MCEVKKEWGQGGVDPHNNKLTKPNLVLNLPTDITIHCQLSGVSIGGKLVSGVSKGGELVKMSEDGSEAAVVGEGGAGGDIVRGQQFLVAPRYHKLSIYY